MGWRKSTQRAPPGLVKEHSLTSALKVKLERLIFEGKIGASERSTESDLAARFRTSRGPLREALQALGEQGLVSFAKKTVARSCDALARGGGGVVRPARPPRDEVGRKLTGKLTQEQNATLETLLYKMDVEAKSSNIAAYYGDNLKFHDLL